MIFGIVAGVLSALFQSGSYALSRAFMLKHCCFIRSWRWGRWVF